MSFRTAAAMTHSIIQDFTAPDHDHASCVDAAMGAAEKLCEARGERLTPLRRRVLQLVWDSHRPVKAYELLELLADGGKRPAPPTVYRALEFLHEAGLVHRLESLNAFVGCAKPTQRHSAQFLICRACGSVAELNDAGLSAKVVARAGKLGFAVEEQRIEIKGLCPDCR